MRRLYFKENEITVIKKMCEMLEHNILNDRKINITAFSISRNTGLSYNTVRQKLKKIKDL